MVGTTQKTGYLAIQTMPSLRNLVTPAMSGIQHIPISSSFMSSPRPLVISPNIVVSTDAFNNPFGCNPLPSSNPQAQMPRGNVPNMHIRVGGIFLPLPPIGQPRSSLIDLPP